MPQIKSKEPNYKFPCKAARRYRNSGGLGKFKMMSKRKVSLSEKYSLNGTNYTIEIISTGFGDKAISTITNPVIKTNEKGINEDGIIILDFDTLIPNLKNSTTDIIETWYRARFWCWARENNCDVNSRAAWTFFKNSDPSGQEGNNWSYEKSQRFEKFYEDINVGGYYLTITYVSTECGEYSLSYCREGLDYIDDGVNSEDGHLFRSGTICLGYSSGGNSGVYDSGQPLEWVIPRSRYWAVAFAYWCEYGNWMDP